MGAVFMKEPFIEAYLCNRLYITVVSRVLETCHPVHTERVSIARELAKILGHNFTGVQWESNRLCKGNLRPL